LFLIFEAQGKTMLLLREAIAHEIEKCNQAPLVDFFFPFFLDNSNN